MNTTAFILMVIVLYIEELKILQKIAETLYNVQCHTRTATLYLMSGTDKVI